MKPIKVFQNFIISKTTYKFVDTYKCIETIDEETKDEETIENELIKEINQFSCSNLVEITPKYKYDGTTYYVAELGCFYDIGYTRLEALEKLYNKLSRS